ncbi:hypothetical protein MMC17_006315 [Xylographa soralifera]|nr:hypothetical protein [Xylographa soralifera]
MEPHPLKSTGGPSPPTIFPSHPVQTPFFDHRHVPALTVYTWSGPPSSRPRPPLFAFPLYICIGRDAALAGDVPAQILAALQRVSGELLMCRLDVYFMDGDWAACVRHYRGERAARGVEAGTGLTSAREGGDGEMGVVPTYTQGGVDYAGFVLRVDTLEWEWDGHGEAGSRGVGMCWFDTVSGGEEVGEGGGAALGGDGGEGLEGG